MAAITHLNMPCNFCDEKVRLSARVEAVEHSEEDDDLTAVMRLVIDDPTALVEHIKAQHADVDLGTYG